MEEVTGVDALVIDNACEGGVVISILFDAIGNTSDVRIVCRDVDKSMVKSAAERIKADGWNAEAIVVDAQTVPFPDNHFTHKFMNLGMQLIPDKALAVKGAPTHSSLHFTINPAGSNRSPPRFAVPPSFTSGPMASKESITNLLTAGVFVHIDVQPLTFEHTDNVSRFVAYMKEVFAPLLGDKAGKWDAHMQERYGHGDFTLTWKAFGVTAEKP
ncbi:hypothetical protein B0H17DRAFT_1197020 [Mycena rosella]|uniref:Methyltransferase domain-containing protein n=1 Tax=Mycena rosella TaxID=1033263 RepID=A0AAD7DTL1_MYCRO|nr:hypothetical protein B0H17DRAFT_1197020 [Mycena rosella]